MRILIRRLHPMLVVLTHKLLVPLPEPFAMPRRRATESNIRQEPSPESNIRQESGPDSNIRQEPGPESNIRQVSGLDSNIRQSR